MIRKATQNDLFHIHDMAVRATKRMNAEGSDQWDKTYPTTEHFQKDIHLGSLYVYEHDEKLIGSITIDQSFSPEYGAATLKWNTPQASAGTFHRLLVDPDVRKKGTAKALITFAESYFKEHGCTALQIDTYSINHKAQRLFESCGFTNTGEFYFPGKETAFLGFEKTI
ncbi:acetyltransferase [Bacillus sp. JCM 19046]|uniref:GNAT superfamily N-acetyltransferase n=1 Tax=Shouchella xiaoxiensis TaxID=766895 RepID=A0ABS2ST42_9BACI|nr:GNAT family N-acetyltransferase [Shouchella xiaoxiensis]MBM7838703.1 GNAT superfamily N-acetyltransferase [Shouchella xiaoxiensis]GAF11854.1 acetyltransferase [Bacillus sp. JCM 19045]GAF16146.1 acetyltransferase [Bacillus sp. JCM 19046]